MRKKIKRMNLNGANNRGQREFVVVKGKATKALSDKTFYGLSKFISLP